MTYQVVFTPRALKDLEALPEAVKKRLLLKLQDYSLKPLDFARKLTNAKIGSYRFKIGDYRIVFDFDKTTIVVLRVGHGKSIYR